MLHLLNGHRVIPVLAHDDPSAADFIASALVAADLPIVEVTFRSPRSAELLGALVRYPELVVGAGTVTTPEQVDQAVQLGAQFLVSPGVSRRVITQAKAAELPIVPGIATASDIMTAREEGLTLMKFFPAEKLGGLSTLTTYAQVFPDVRFIPTGGIKPTNLDEYLGTPCVAAVGGTWFFDTAVLAAGDTQGLTEVLRSGRRAS